MTATRCAATTKNGSLCQAQPLPGSPFCPFHDPTRATAFAAGRCKGGAASHRRPRRFPRLLDYRHVAELVGELFVDALNQADVADPRSLSALNQLSRTLLLAVGHPKASYVHYEDRAEPALEAPHLLRVYRPAAPEIEALLADPPAASATADPGGDPAAQPSAPASEPELSSDALMGLTPSEEIDDAVSTLLSNRVPGLNTPDLDAWLDAYAAVRPAAVPTATSPSHRETLRRLADLIAPAAPSSAPQALPQAPPQATSQADNKPLTSHSATTDFLAAASHQRDTSLPPFGNTNHDIAPFDPDLCATLTLPGGRPQPAPGRRPTAPRRRR